MIDVISEKLNFNNLENKFISVDGSCNGLVLVVNRKKINFLINPTTLKYHGIPNFELALPDRESKSLCGLGYDVASDDYKVVNLSFYDTDELVVDDTFVDVYSAKKGVWRRLESSPYDHSRATAASGVLVNGALHWLTSRSDSYSCVIVAFDLSDEKSSEVPAPADRWIYFDFELVALRGRLCMFYILGADTITFYMMKEYGVQDSWTMFSITAPALNEIFCTPLCSIADDDIVMDAEGKLVVYNMKEDVFWDPTIDASHDMNKARTFIDSLVSPSYGNGIKG